MRSSFIHTLVVALTCAASAATAQPADRFAAFTAVIGSAQANAPSHVFYEAELKDKGSRWVIDVEMMSGNGAQIIEYEFDASTLLLRETSVESVSSSKQTQLLTILGLLPGASVPPAAAINTIAPRTPDGTRPFKIEREVESGVLFYRFHFLGPSGETRLFVNATTGAPSSGTGSGSGNPPSSGSVTLTQAIALAVANRPGVVREVEFESGDNSWKVRILTTAGVLYEVEISAATGAVIGTRLKDRSLEDKAEDRLVHIGMGLANITDAQILALAATAAPGATPVKIEREFEHGRLIVKVVVQDAGGLRVLRFDSWNAGQPASPPVEDVVPGAPTASVSPAAAINAALAVIPGAFAVELELETEGGRAFYRVKTLTTAPLRLRETVVDAKTGVVRGTSLLPMSTGFLADAARINARRAGLAIGFAQAIQSVQTQIPDGTIVKIELEPEGSGLVYSVDARVGSRTFSMRVDGRTGFTSPR